MNEKTRVAINLAVFGVVFGAMLVWAAGNVVTVDRLERPYSLTLYSDAASGISANAEVAYLGVHYGRVTGVDLMDGGVRIDMLIDRGRQIPVGSTPRIFRKSAIGEPYIDFNPPAGFDPGAEDVQYYEDDDEVVDADGQRVLAQVPLEFSELLRSASELIGNIEPDQAASLLSELATGLEGRGEDLRRFTTAVDELSATFAERTETLDRLTENNTRLTHVLADHRGALGSTISDLALLASSLRNAAGDTQVLLDRGTDLVALAADLIEDTRPAVDCLLDDLVPVMGAAATPDRLADLEHYLQTGPTGYGLLADTVAQEADGPWVRVHLTLDLTSPPQQYVPPKPLPPIQPLVACPGVVTTAGGPAAPAGDFRPSTVLSGPGSLPATGTAVAAGLAALLLAGAYALRRITRSVDG